MKIRQGLPLKAHLALFCLVCFIPACLAVAAIGLNLAHEEQDRVEREAARLVAEFSGTVETEVSALTRVTLALATSPALASEDYPLFREQAVAVAAANGASIALRRADGQHIVSTIVPLGTDPMPVTNDPVLRRADMRALETKSPAVSDLYVGISGRVPFVSIVVPVVSPKSGTLLLTLAVRPERIAERLRLGERAAQGWLAAIAGSDSRVIGRTRDLDRFVGQPATGDLAKAMQRSSSGSLLSTTLDGVAVFTAFQRGAQGWTTVVSVPVAVLEQPVRTLIHSLLVIGAVTLLATAAGASAYGTYLGRQVALLAENAGRIGRHVPLKPFDWVVRELGLAQQALAQASEKTESLLRELDHRVKNTLAVIQSLATRTVSDPGDRETLAGRVAALAHAHEALSQRRWEAVPLRDLVGAVCVPHGERLTRSGPAVSLTPRATTALAQVLQELWANAQEHGALSGTGSVALQWQVADGTLSFRWQESGGPPASGPARGLGLKLAELCVVRQLNGRLEVAAAPEGWTVTFAVPLQSELGVTGWLMEPLDKAG